MKSEDIGSTANSPRQSHKGLFTLARRRAGNMVHGEQVGVCSWGLMTRFSCHHSRGMSFSQWHKNNIGGKYEYIKQLVRMLILRLWAIHGLSFEQALLVSQASPAFL